MRFELALHERLPGGFTLDVEFDVTAQALALVGESGAGKSTLLTVLAGLRRGGRVVLDGRDVSALPSRARRVGLVTQDALLFPHLDVRANLGFGARAEGIGEVAEALDLTPLLDRMPRFLSGGEQRRVALGRALASRPDLLLLDEPFAGLDAGRRRAALSLIHRVRERFGLPLVLVSHVPDEVMGLADHAVRMVAGRVVAEGEPTTVLRAGETGIDNHLVVEVSGPDRVSLGGVELVLPLPEGASGALRVAIRAHDVLLSTVPPVGLSARNVFPATVAEVLPAAGAFLVRLADVPIVATVTASARDELKLAPGASVHAVLKATSLAVLGRA